MSKIKTFLLIFWFILLYLMKFNVFLIFVLISLLFASGCTQSNHLPDTSTPQTTAITPIKEIVTPISSNPISSTYPSLPPSSPPSGLLTVRYLDVGQGDSILIQTPSGKNMLIDAGPTKAGSKVASDLKDMGIINLDIVLATHPHEDHIGGMSSVLNKFSVKQFIDCGYPDTTKTYENMLNLIDQKNIPFKTVKDGDTISLDSGVTFSVLNPTATFSDDINQNSIVLKMTYGGVSFLFMGDANSDAEQRIANSGTTLDADILKVGHHGSATSSNSLFLSKVKPKVSIIEVGAGNPYGHPTAATLNRLSNVGSAIYRTDLNGDITVTTDGTTYKVESENTHNEVSAVLDSDATTSSSSSKTVINSQIVNSPSSTSSSTSSSSLTKAVTKKPTTKPTTSSQGSTGGTCDCSSNKYNCKDFSSPAAAQACYDYCKSLGKGDIHDLDRDHDGIACEAS